MAPNVYGEPELSEFGAFVESSPWWVQREKEGVFPELIPYLFSGDSDNRKTGQKFDCFLVMAERVEKRREKKRIIKMYRTR